MFYWGAEVVVTVLKVLLSILAQVCDHLEDKPVDDLGAREDADPGADAQQAADVGDHVKHRHPLVGLVFCIKHN